MFEHGWWRGILLVRLAYLAQRHDIDWLMVLKRGTGQAVSNDGEIVPHRRRQAVEVDLVYLCDRLWGIRRRSGVPDLRGRGDDGEEDI